MEKPGKRKRKEKRDRIYETGLPLSSSFIFCRYHTNSINLETGLSLFLLYSIYGDTKNTYNNRTTHEAKRTV